MPPVYYSSSVRMSETVQCEKLKIRKGDVMTIVMSHLCNDPAEWIEPGRFIPERFSQDSPYFLTPEGKRRNPYSFSPFLGGNRICIGKTGRLVQPRIQLFLRTNLHSKKTFIEVVSKLTVPTLLSHVKFEFKEGVDRDSVPYMHNNMTARWIPDFKALVTERHLTYKLQ